MVPAGWLDGAPKGAPPRVSPVPVVFGAANPEVAPNVRPVLDVVVAAPRVNPVAVVLGVPKPNPKIEILLHLWQCFHCFFQ